MLIKVKRIFYRNNYTDSRISLYAAIALTISIACLLINIANDDCRNLIGSSNISNVTIAVKILVCNISPENCRCSDSSNSSVQCIPDIKIMASHVLPLVSYVLQLYVISKVFRFTGNHKDTLTDIFWTASLFIFIFILIAVHGSCCLRIFTTVIISAPGMYLSFYIMMLTKHMSESNSPDEIPDNYRDHESRL